MADSLLKPLHRGFLKKTMLAIIVIGIAISGWYMLGRRARVNVLLVTLDTTRVDRLGAYGYKNGITTGFDELAARGVIFDRAYAPAPVTLPSHATMLTGLYPPEHGLRINGQGTLSKTIAVLPEILQQQGYGTAAFIAAAVLDGKYGLERGFDVYDDDLAGVTRKSLHGEARRDGEDVTGAALKWMESQSDQAFFCWIHLYDAHAPYDPRPENYGDKFQNSPYDAGVAWECRQLGRLSQFLKKQGLDEHTLVVLVADHGEGLGDHGEQEHGMLVYDTTVRVPFVMAGPGIPHTGTRIQDLVSLADLAPTVCDILELPWPARISGRSLLPAVRQETLEPRAVYAETETPFVYSRWCPQYSVISEQWKYIETTRPELYDLLSDPGENLNLADASPGTEHASILAETKNQLAAMQSEFMHTDAGSLTLSENDRKNLESLGYVSGGTSAVENPMQKNSVTLPDVKEMLPVLGEYESAQELAAQGNYSPAVEKLQKIVQSTEHFPAAELLLGDLLAQAGKLQDAEACYVGVVKKRPDFLRAWFNLGRICGGQSRFAEAESHFRECVRLDPANIPVRMELGNVLVQQKRTDEAATVYQQLVQQHPDFIPAYLKLAQPLVQKQPHEAAKWLEQADLRASGNADVAGMLMIAHVQCGQPAKALQAAQRGLRQNPDSFELRFNLGMLLLSLDRPLDAMNELRKADQLRPGDPRCAEQIRRLQSQLLQKSP